MTTARYWLRESVPARVPAPRAADFPVAAIRRDFPILHRPVDGNPLVWLDNAATTQKPLAVVESLVDYYLHDNSNVHRGAHALARRATEAYEGARAKVAAFLGAGGPEEVVFVRGTTEAVNLVAGSWGEAEVRAGDEIVLTELEHHANIVPWQQLARRRRATLKVVPIDATGALDLDAFRALLSQRTALVAVTHASNVLGTVPPIREMVALAHRYGARVLVDGAQAVGHFPVDVRALDVDFYVLSGHKMFAPTGIGVLYAKREVLATMGPWQTGGNMIDRVTFGGSTFAGQPHRMEAGTADIAGAVGLGAAVDYLRGLDRERVRAHERHLAEHACRALAEVPGLRLFGAAPGRVAVHSFLVDGTDPVALAAHLDRRGIAVRVGHHCAQPTLAALGEAVTVRASPAFYNTTDEVDALVGAVLEFVAGGVRPGPAAGGRRPGRRDR
ncbi:cysteine desulfurase [Actinosynnema sp. NPDC047251]|uniref:Cysteine desulfurase n=1 Tax=Saccharothrix espanaensis (strain ATCC 51144 / DSM 44229 / JCM 9112 / NBRC 15066 / NRRL 15764) TaxID=1179773 RepID=K0K4H5_SACES|nr:cysteine desulfurase [Saccharothrix espanaensis]CCH31774.1 putative cysteine desulfurase [Saccharothrix espanaensis DSM 44229]